MQCVTHLFSGASLVKGIPFNVTDTEVSGPDIFQRLVPMEAHEASSLYRYFVVIYSDNFCLVSNFYDVFFRCKSKAMIKYWWYWICRIQNFMYVQWLISFNFLQWRKSETIEKNRLASWRKKSGTEVRILFEK